MKRELPSPVEPLVDKTRSIEIVTGCNYSRQLLEYENKIKSLEDQLNLPLHLKVLTND